jgi:hypothetical protein
VEPERPDVAAPIQDTPYISRESEKFLGALLIPLGILIAVAAAFHWAPATLLLIVVHVLLISTMWMRNRLRRRVEAARRRPHGAGIPREMSAGEVRDYFERRQPR